MKTVSAATATHLAGDVLTLASCWRITRSDGVVLRFTDHDEDVVFPTALTLTVQVAKGETFLSVGAFSRTAIQTRVSLKVDNVDLAGLINPDSVTSGIKLSDLQTGRFNDATIEIFLVDWTSPSDGVVSMIRGNLGELMLDVESKTYKAELRSLKQKFAIQLGELYTPKCRADLFDARCKLLASDFSDVVQVEAVTSQSEFAIPAKQTLVAPEPTRTSGLRTSAVEDGVGVLRLRRGPTQLGTPDDPILVTTPADLDAIRNNPHAWYALTADVDMSGFGLWTPIPNFRGGIDGRGHAIVGLNVDNSASAAQAAFIDRLEQGSIVRRLGFVVGEFQSGSAAFSSAPLAAQIGTGAPSGLFGRVEDCYAIGCRVDGGSLAMSGLVAQVDDLKHVRRCLAACVFSGSLVGSNKGHVIGLTVGAGADAVAQVDNYADADRQKVASPGTGETGTTELTTAQANADATFVGFDFLNTWLAPSEQTAAAFADGGGDLTFADGGASPDTITRTTGSWIADGFERGDLVLVAGTTSNDGSFNVDTVTATVLTMTSVDVLAAEVIAGSTAGLSLTAGKYPKLKTQQVP